MHETKPFLKITVNSKIIGYEAARPKSPNSNLCLSRPKKFLSIENRITSQHFRQLVGFNG